MKVFLSSEQITDNISPPKHDHCDFERSLRIHIRHDSDNERKYCTSNKKQTLFEFFLQFFKSLERTLSSSFELSQCLKVKAGALHKKKSCILLAFGTRRRARSQRKKNKKIKERAPPQGAHVLASAPTRWRETTWCFLLQTLLSTTCVCVVLSISYLVLGLRYLCSGKLLKEFSLYI